MHQHTIEGIGSKLANKNIKLLGIRAHAKATEVYVDVVFHYAEENHRWEGSVPIEYRRTGVECKTDEQAANLIGNTYEFLRPSAHAAWIKIEEATWQDGGKKVTREFFYSLLDGTWKCTRCQMPRNNNPTRRIQDIKEAGYTIATQTHKLCSLCNEKCTHLLLLPVPKGSKTGYENWSPALRKRILKVLNNFDVYECRQRQNLLPDHKFPEIRWDKNTREENPENMTDEQIKRKFQLLSNQRNEQKREVCRKCYQTGVRGYPLGVMFYYEGEPNWPHDVPKRGKDAERGCQGCGWYDMAKWREELQKRAR